MNYTGQVKTVKEVVVVKGKEHTVEISPDKWEKHKEQIRAYIRGSDIEVDVGGRWCHVYNPQWLMHQQYRAKVTNQPEAAQIWKDRNGTHYVYSYEQGMVSLDTGEVYHDYDPGDVIYVCDHYTKIPR